MANYEFIKVETEGPLTILTLNRPEKYNALATAVLTEIVDFLHTAKNDPEIRALMITGAGKGFCAGADMDDWNDKFDAEIIPDPVKSEQIWTDLAHEMIISVKTFPKPVVAAVNGAAVGLGCDLALACDRRFASTNAKFGEFYIRRGYAPDGGGSWLLPRLIGWAEAADMIYTGRLVKADEAKELRIVNVLCEPDKLIEEAKAYALLLANGPTIGIIEAKKNLLQSEFMTLENELRLERQSGVICGHTEDEKEGVKAFMEGRDPVYKGR